MACLRISNSVISYDIKARTQGMGFIQQVVLLVNLLPLLCVVKNACRIGTELINLSARRLCVTVEEDEVYTCVSKNLSPNDSQG